MTRRLLFFLISLHIGLMLSAQQEQSGIFKPLESFRFEAPHEYTLVMRPQSGSRGDSIIFYTRSAEVLLKYQEAWAFDKQAVVYPFACNDGYDISLMKNGREINSFAIKFRCQAFVADNFFWHTNPGQSTLFISLMEKAYQRHSTYEDIEDARKALELLRTNEKVVFMLRPDWEVHDGYFFFNVANPNFSGKGPHIEWEEITKGVQDEIQKAYPEEQPDISLVSYGYGKSYSRLGFKVHGSKSFYEKFDLYPLSSSGWRYFKIELEYWLSM